MSWTRTWGASGKSNRDTRMAGTIFLNATAPSSLLPSTYPCHTLHRGWDRTQDRAFKRHERVCRVRTPDGHCASPVGIRPCQVWQSLGEHLQGHQRTRHRNRRTRKWSVRAARCTGSRQAFAHSARHMRAPVKQDKTRAERMLPAPHHALARPRSARRADPAHRETTAASASWATSRRERSKLAVTLSLRRDLACSAARNRAPLSSAYRDFAIHCCGARTTVRPRHEPQALGCLAPATPTARIDATQHLHQERRRSTSPAAPTTPK